MTLFRSLALGCATLALMACTPLMRGVQNGSVVSDAQPPVTMTSTLPVRVSGRADPFVNTDRGFVTPEAAVAVYGGETAEAPMAIVAFAAAPDLMRWDFPSFCYVDGPVTTQVNFGGQVFSGAVRKVNGERDPFAILVAPQDKVADVWWLAQRFTVLDNFYQSKLILEYREPLPASLRDSEIIPTLQPEIEAFAARAQAAFKVDFAFKGPLIQRGEVIPEINRRYLGPFLGSLTPIDPLLFDRL